MATDKYLSALKRSFGIDGYENFDSYDYLHAIGFAKQALLYAGLFCPDLIEIEDIVLLKMKVDDEVNLKEFYKLKSDGKHTRQEIEKSFNFVEVPYCFASKRNDLSEEDEILLAEFIANSWRGRLMTKYPDRKFRVMVAEAGDLSDVVAVVFFEERDTYENRKVQSNVT